MRDLIMHKYDQQQPCMLEKAAQQIVNQMQVEAKQHSVCIQAERDGESSKLYVIQRKMRAFVAVLSTRVPAP
jgi:hypothetical protein